MADIHNYAFIDGNYLRRAYEDTMRKFFPDANGSNIELVMIKHYLQASKVFYYDSVDTDAPDAVWRAAAMESISAIDGFHVRKGTISKKGKQKQVDVQLAVDALTHAFNKNFWHVSLIAGDLDFKPLVDALIQLGIHVHVYYESYSGAKPLYLAADVGIPMSIVDFYNWSSQDYRLSRPRPQDTHNAELPGGANSVVKVGTWKDRPVQLLHYGQDNSYVLFAPPHHSQAQRWLAFSDKDRLLLYFKLVHGDIVWN